MAVLIVIVLYCFIKHTHLSYCHFKWLFILCHFKWLFLLSLISLVVPPASSAPAHAPPLRPRTNQPRPPPCLLPRAANHLSIDQSECPPGPQCCLPTELHASVCCASDLSPCPAPPSRSDTPLSAMPGGFRGDGVPVARCGRRRRASAVCHHAHRVVCGYP